MEEGNSTMEEMCNSVVHLIDRHIDFDVLMEEMSNDNFCEKTLKNPSSLSGENDLESHNTVQTLLECLKLKSSVCSINIETAALQMLMKKLCEISQSHRILTHEDDVFVTITTFKETGTMSHVDISVLTQYQECLKHCLPMNVLLQLHEKNIIYLQDYLIINVQNKQVLKEFIWSLQRIARQANVEEDMNKNTAAGILTLLIRYAYDNASSNSKALRKMCGYILFNIVKSHLMYLLKLPVLKSLSSKEGNRHIISIIREKMQDGKAVLRRCFTQMISLWVTDSPTLKVSDVISMQHSWTACKQNEDLTRFYKEMSSLTAPSEIIRNVLERREVNWKNLLTFVSAFLISFPDSSKELDGLINEKLKEGFETSSTECLAVSFLLARQLSLEGSHAFTSYAGWFQRHFGPQSTSLQSSRSFRFFTRFLTDLVPYEPAKYLKVHIVKPPHGPSSCTEKLHEYISLARCRLSELGGCVAELEKDSEQSLEAEEDVKKVLEEFERTKKLPKSVLEASIFKKTYFCTKFLPSLLKPRPLPTRPDNTMRLIEELSKEQKIPKNMLAAYKEGCKRENTKLLEEVMVLDDDSPFEDEDEDPCKQLETLLQVIGGRIENCGSQTADPSSGSQSVPCEMLTKLKRILLLIENEEKSSLSNDDEIDLCTPVTKSLTLNKTAAIILEWLGKFQDAIACAESKHHPVAFSLSKILMLLREHKSITGCICQSIWNICTQDISKASIVKLKGISVYLAVAGSSVVVCAPVLSHCMSKIRKSGLCKIKPHSFQPVCSSNFLTVIIHSLKLYGDEDSAIKTVGFITYLAINTLLLVGTIDEKLLFHFHYIDKRCSCKEVQKQSLEAREEAKNVKRQKTLDYEIEECRAFLKEARLKMNIVNVSLPPSEFLQREMHIDEKNDFLNTSERETLYNSVFFGVTLTHKSITSLIHAFLDERISNQDVDTEDTNTDSKEISKAICTNLPIILEGCGRNETNAKFILEVLHNRISRYSSGLCSDIMWKNEVDNIVSFLLHLPTTFLFHLPSANSLHVMSSMWQIDSEPNQCRSECLDCVTTLVNSYFMKLERESALCFALPQKLTAHLITGLVQFVKSTDELLQYITVTCPLLLISLIVVWQTNLSFQYFVKVRNPELHLLICELSYTLSCTGASKNMATACETLMSKLNMSQEIFGGITENEEKHTAFIHLCSACAFMDSIQDTLSFNNLTQLMDGGSKEMLGYVTWCGLWKLQDLYLTSKSSDIERRATKLKMILKYAIANLEPGYLCDDVLQSNLIGLSLCLPEEKLKYFFLAALRCLSIIPLPQPLLKHKKFLPAFLHLSESSQLLFGNLELYSVSNMDPSVVGFQERVIREAPDDAILKALQKSYQDATINTALRCEAARRKFSTKVPGFVS